MSQAAVTQTDAVPQTTAITTGATAVSEATAVSGAIRPVYASPTDVATYGEYTIRRDPADTRPLYRFTGRITADGSSGFAAEPGRYHIYSGWFCPWAHRVLLERALHGLEDVISVSYVDGSRDARGWGFRESYGPDPVNGFTLLRDAYERTEPGFDGHVSVPTLWDRQTGQVVSNDFTSLGIDLATQFGRWSNGADTYPEHLRAEIAELDSWIGPAVNHGAHRAAHDDAVRAALLDAFARLDARLADTPYLVGGQLTEADVRLWVSLVRYRGRRHDLATLPPLSDYPHLWTYARALYQLPAFRATTDFTTFSEPTAVLPGWDTAPGDDA